MALVLKVEQLSKNFRGVQALEDVDVGVQEGEILGLIGPNGSGKTTLFNCITGFVRPTSGHVFWRGTNITRLAADQVARLGVVRTFQQKMVFPNHTVRENLVMAWRGGGDGGGQPFKRLDEVLEFLGLAQIQERDASDIPFGLGRKLGLGLALAVHPQILLLDEPSAGLNREESEELAELIRKIRDRGITVWVIEHNVPLIMSLSERIIVLHAGRKIAEGPPASIAADPNVISVYLGKKHATGTST